MTAVSRLSNTTQGEQRELRTVTTGSPGTTISTNLIAFWSTDHTGCGLLRCPMYDLAHMLFSHRGHPRPQLRVLDRRHLDVNSLKHFLHWRLSAVPLLPLLPLYYHYYHQVLWFPIEGKGGGTGFQHHPQRHTQREVRPAWRLYMSKDHLATGLWA